MPASRLKSSLARCGGVPLPGEANGVLRSRGRPWVQVETAAASFGQGVSTTTLQLAMAIALGGLFSHLGFSGVRPGLILGAGLWLGLVLPTLAVNVVFQQRNPMLIAIDGGHWLLILAILGGVIGAFS